VKSCETLLGNGGVTECFFPLSFRPQDLLRYSNPKLPFDVVNMPHTLGKVAKCSRTVQVFFKKRKKTLQVILEGVQGEFWHR
jgi:hypothetical protein